MAGMKVCLICGKDFYDGSRNDSKVTCSNKCRDALLYQDLDKKFERSVQMRLAVMKRSYGIVFDEETIEQIKADLKHEKCMVCGRERSENEKSFCIDHDHVTNKYRGILCPQCNQALGMARDSSANLLKLLWFLMNSQIDDILKLYPEAAKDERLYESYWLIEAAMNTNADVIDNIRSVAVGSNV